MIRFCNSLSWQKQGVKKMGKSLRNYVLSEEEIRMIQKYVGLPSVAVDVLSGNKLIALVLKKIKEEVQ